MSRAAHCDTLGNKLCLCTASLNSVMHEKITDNGYARFLFFNEDLLALCKDSEQLRSAEISFPAPKFAWSCTLQNATLGRMLPRSSDQNLWRDRKGFEGRSKSEPVLTL